MSSYYSRHLAGKRLRRCYDLAPARVRQYLEAEISYLSDRIGPADVVLELGCGYGRIAVRLAAAARRVVGIDTSFESLALARDSTGDGTSCEFVQMDATALGFTAAGFDVVVGAQNGLAAFGADPAHVLAQALRVTRPGGRIIFSSYSAAFWPERLRWFELQAAAGLVGPIDYRSTRDGVIVCHDGFRATTFGPGEFRSLCGAFGIAPRITTVDGSSVVCEIEVAGPSV